MDLDIWIKSQATLRIIQLKFVLAMSVFHLFPKSLICKNYIVYIYIYVLFCGYNERTQRTSCCMFSTVHFGARHVHNNHIETYCMYQEPSYEASADKW
jgi:hypothetical protein